MLIQDVIKEMVKIGAERTRIYMEDCGVADGDDICVLVARGESATALRAWDEDRQAEEEAFEA